jgi:osmotically inducible protein OsmC
MAVRINGTDKEEASMDAIYTAHGSATGGRDGRARSDDGKVDVELSLPKEMGGNGKGTNPEQLFACGYAACFLGAVKFVAKEESIDVPDGAKVSADVGIGKLERGFGLKVDLAIELPGVPRDKAEALVARAHNEICPYSNATRGNVEVTTRVV